MSGKDIIKIVLALVFISLLLWLIFSEDTTLNGNEDGEEPEYYTGTYNVNDNDNLVVYENIDQK